MKLGVCLYNLAQKNPKKCFAVCSRDNRTIKVEDNYIYFWHKINDIWIKYELGKSSFVLHEDDWDYCDSPEWNLKKVITELQRGKMLVADSPATHPCYMQDVSGNIYVSDNEHVMQWRLLLNGVADIPENVAYKVNKMYDSKHIEYYFDRDFDDSKVVNWLYHELQEFKYTATIRHDSGYEMQVIYIDNGLYWRDKTDDLGNKDHSQTWHLFNLADYLSNYKDIIKTIIVPIKTQRTEPYKHITVKLKEIL